MLYAAIDIGTVTCRLLVCKLERGIQQELVRECRIVNLGIGVSKTGILQEDAIERVVSCVKEYCELVRAIAQKEEVPSIPIGAVATSASRDARNAGELVSRLHEIGVDLLVIAGEVEADLSFRGASAEFPGERLVVVDVGGGSTEVIFGSAQEGVLFSHSFNIGCRRITEMFLISDPPRIEELANAREFITEELHSVLGIRFEGFFADRVVAVAGTATSVVSVDEAMEVYDSARVHKTVVSRETLSRVATMLAALPEEERKCVVGLEPKRAGVIVAGMLILECVLDVLGQDSFTVSESDILQGIIAALDRRIPPFDDTISEV